MTMTHHPPRWRIALVREAEAPSFTTNIFRTSHDVADAFRFLTCPGSDLVGQARCSEVFVSVPREASILLDMFGTARARFAGCRDQPAGARWAGYAGRRRKT